MKIFRKTQLPVKVVNKTILANGKVCHELPYGTRKVVELFMSKFLSKFDQLIIYDVIYKLLVSAYLQLYNSETELVEVWLKNF